MINDEGDFLGMSNQFKSEEERTMGTIPRFPKSTKPTEPAIRTKEI